jgi:DNA-binding NtrC family response regulator
VLNSLYERKLLIVEDSDDDTRLLLNRVSQFHFNYETAMTLGEAYSAADRFKPDIMLVDVFIPFDSMGAIADFQRVLEFISKYAALSAVVMLTGDLNPTHVKMAVAAGACEWIPKNQVTDSPEDFRGHLEKAYRNRLLTADSDMNPGQRLLMQAIQETRNESIISRATAEQLAFKTAKAAKEIAGKAVEDRVRLAEKQAFARGEQSMLVKIRTKKIALWATSTITVGTVGWTLRTFFYQLFLMAKHRIGL